MARVIACDICKKIVPEDNLVTLKLWFPFGTRVDEEKDLCLECANKVSKYMRDYEDRLVYDG